MVKLKKEEAVRKKELKQLKEENKKMNSEIGKIQYDKDKIEAENKSKDKLVKMKKNTLLFNKIIEKQIADGDIVNVDISMYEENIWKNVMVVNLVVKRLGMGSWI